MDAVQSIITEAAAKQIEEARNFLENKVQSVTITTESEYAGAGALITALKSNKKALDDTRKAEKEEYLNNGRKVDSEFNPIILALTEKIEYIERAGRDYRRKQEEIAAAAQKRLDDAAEAERKALEAQAGTKAEKAARLREKAIELTRKAAKEKDPSKATNLLQEAQKYEQRACGYDERAEAKKEQAQTLVAPIVQPAVPQAHRGGFNTRTIYSAKITDMVKVLDHLKNGVPPAVSTAISSWTNAAARSSHGAASTIPGVEFYKI
jgi:hypothetical protein